MNSKNMTATEFFKQDEAVRGDIDSRDKSFAATQQEYFNNMDIAENGRPDSFNRIQSDIGVDYINKSEMGRSDHRKAAGLVTPHGDRIADQIDYLNKSEAEYGRQSSVRDRNATVQ